MANGSFLIPRVLSMLCALIFMACPVYAAPGFSVRSPEEANIAPTPTPNTGTCGTDRDCPSPIPSNGQLSQCLEARCSGGTCSTAILNGKSLATYEAASPLACTAALQMCGADGKPTASTDRTQRQVIREGESCLHSASTIGECEYSACVQGECALLPADQAPCTDAGVNTGPCQSKQCLNRQCRAIADLSRVGQTCGPSEIASCKAVSQQCSPAGTCDAVAVSLAPNAECAPDGTMAPAGQLPAAFITLFVNAITPPQHECDSSQCKLLYCGDGIITSSLGEQCDGSTKPASATPDSTCTSACKLEFCGDGIVNRNEQCDSGILKAGLAANSVCDNSTCTAAITPTCSDLSVSMTRWTLNRQDGLFDIAFTVKNPTALNFNGYNSRAYIVITNPTTLVSNVWAAIAWYTALGAVCTNDQCLTAVNYRGQVLPAIRLDSLPAITSNSQLTVSTGSRLYLAQRDPRLVQFSAQLVCEDLEGSNPP